MSHEYQHSDTGHDWLSDTGYEHDLHQMLFDLNGTDNGGNFMSDVNHIIDEITAVPHDLIPENQNHGYHDYGVGNEHLPPIDFTEYTSGSASAGSFGPSWPEPPTDIHSVGYDASGHWQSWGLDPATNIPTFAPDPESFGMPISTTDPGSSDS